MAASTPPAAPPPDGKPPAGRPSAPSMEGRRASGFHPAAIHVAPKLEAAAKRRGFAEARLLTDWAAIAGPEIAAAARPLRMSRGRPGPGGGGTLTILVAAGRGPEVQMMLPVLKGRVNAALGWHAVAQIRVTQAPGGFAEDPAPYAPPAPAPPDPARLASVEDELSSIGDGPLRRALETLALSVLSRGAR